MEIPYCSQAKVSKLLDNCCNKMFLNGVTYKYTLAEDSAHRIGEANENNNTAEATVTARAIKNADYLHTSARISVQTGDDNKEVNNSLIYFEVGVAN